MIWPTWTLIRAEINERAVTFMHRYLHMILVPNIPALTGREDQPNCTDSRRLPMDWLSSPPSQPGYSSCYNGGDFVCWRFPL